MRKFLLSTVIACLSLVLSAQTQHGYVKTKGRMVNGRHVAGKGLPGATVSIQGGNSVGVKNANGSFSFVVPAKTYMVQSVQKKGYELVDADAVRKPYQHSVNPLCLVMETPEQQMEDLLEAQEQISKTLREQLKKSRQEIQRLKDENKITEEDYRQRLAKLMEDQQNSQKLIADMAKEYSQMDYDQMDSLNQHISDAILNGRLMEADSLLRSKGDMKKRIAEVRKEQQAEAQEEQELAQRQENLEASKEGTKKKLEDIAVDCYKFFDRFKIENQHDSAAYYIELRAELDTTIAAWQFDAAKYLHKQNQFSKSSIYYERALFIYRRLAQSNPEAYESDVAQTMNNLAGLYRSTQRFTEGETMYKEALEIRRRLAQSNPQAYELDVAQTQYNLGHLKFDVKRYEEAIPPFEEALNIYRKNSKVNPAQTQWYEGSLDYLSQLYSVVKDYLAAYHLYQEWLPIMKKKYEADPKSLRSDYASKLGNQSFYSIFAKQYAEAEQYAREGLAIDSAEHFIYSNLAASLLFQGKYDEAEKIYRQYKDKLKEGFLDDFKQFAEAGIIPKEREADVERIKRLLEE